MSIKISISAPGMTVQAQVRDEALSELIKLTQEYRDETKGQSDMHSSVTGAGPVGNSSAAPQSEEGIRSWLKSHGAAELLTLVKWESYPEKILLLGAWHEAQGRSTPWRSSDMDAIFFQAKEKAPANFPRDIKQAIKSAWVQPITPRTYTVTGTGWRKVGEAMQRLQII